MDNGKEIIHSRLPINKLTRTAFVPHIVLDQKNGEDRKAFVGVLLQQLVQNLLAYDVQPYILVTETVKKVKQDDGQTREGILFSVSLFVGQNPKLKTADGKSVAEIDNVQLITVGHN